MHQEVPTKLHSSVVLLGQGDELQLGSVLTAGDAQPA